MTSASLAEPQVQIVEVSVFNIKAAVREYLNRYKLINDNTDHIIDMQFGDIVTEKSGNEIVPISLTYMNKGGTED